MDNIVQNTIDNLDELLDAERQALLEGNLDEISVLMKRKEALIDVLNTQEATDRAELKSLNSKVERNQELLNSALEGIRTVARRLAAMRRIRGSLDTYNAQGQKNTINMETESSVEKRA
jgi:flagellar biosynthesis/type III secretory pathway chaperone